MVIGMIFPIEHQQVREEVKHHIIKMFNLSPFMYIIVAFLWFFQCSQECLSIFEKIFIATTARGEKYSSSLIFIARFFVS